MIKKRTYSSSPTLAAHRAPPTFPSGPLPTEPQLLAPEQRNMWTAADVVAAATKQPQIYMHIHKNICVACGGFLLNGGFPGILGGEMEE